MQNLTIYFNILALAHIVIINEEILRAADSEDLILLTPAPVILGILLININIGLLSPS